MNNFVSDDQRKKVMSELNPGGGVGSNEIKIDISVPQSLPESKMLQKAMPEKQNDINTKDAFLKKKIDELGNLFPRFVYSEKEFDEVGNKLSKKYDEFEEMARRDKRYEDVLMYLDSMMHDFDLSDQDPEYEGDYDSAYGSAVNDFQEARLALYNMMGIKL